MRLHGIKTLFAQQNRKSPEWGKVTTYRMRGKSLSDIKLCIKRIKEFNY